ncbi:hypothetical protein [Trinickia sp.]
MIAEHATNDQADIVVLDGASLGFFRRWSTFARLWRRSSKPVAMIR